MSSTSVFFIFVVFDRFEIQTVKAQTIQTKTISFNVLHGASDALRLQLEFDEDAVQSVINHGCWCAKLNTKYKPPFVLGGKAVDDLDHICKLWIQDRRCCKLYGGPCYEQFDNIEYEVEYDPVLGSVNATSCLKNNDLCKTDGCLIDTYYSSQIKQFLENTPQWTSQPASSGTCHTDGQFGGPVLSGYFSFCEGSFNYELGYPEFNIEREFLQCQCPNGTATNGTSCPAPNAISCSACEDGFHLRVPLHRKFFRQGAELGPIFSTGCYGLLIKLRKGLKKP